MIDEKFDVSNCTDEELQELIMFAQKQIESRKNNKKKLLWKDVERSIKTYLKEFKTIEVRGDEGDIILRDSYADLSDPGKIFIY